MKHIRSNHMPTITSIENVSSYMHSQHSMHHEPRIISAELPACHALLQVHLKMTAYLRDIWSLLALAASSHVSPSSPTYGKCVNSAIDYLDEMLVDPLGERLLLYLITFVCTKRQATFRHSHRHSHSCKLWQMSNTTDAKSTTTLRPSQSFYFSFLSSKLEHVTVDEKATFQQRIFKTFSFYSSTWLLPRRAAMNFVSQLKLKILINY